MAASIRVAHTADLDRETLDAIAALLRDVFGDELDDHDVEHSLGGLHALAYAGDGALVGHAALVQRRLLHQGRALRTGYVEGVAVRVDHRGQGIGGALMAPIERAITGAYELGALGATDEAAALYAARGWQLHRGEAHALTPEGVVRTPDEEGSIYLWVNAASAVDATAPLTADWRDGDVW